ncbi:hypothetical protein GO999_12390 [Ralstonia nicotianae]|uniref:Uncharacterized protein n=1 Tax=Ralstonia nicotianae TaxID=3037696 RepID=A0ABX7ZV22_9RALS|nr:hypothetical protein GO999_12390 [Ralstonia nicotianae]
MPKHFESLLTPLGNANPRIPPPAGQDLPHRQRETIAAGRPAGLEIIGVEARFARQVHGNRPHGIAEEAEVFAAQYRAVNHYMITGRQRMDPRSAGVLSLHRDASLSTSFAVSGTNLGTHSPFR